MHDARQSDPPFYVGYLPLPPAIRRFLLPWVVANGVLVLAVAAVIASAQRDPGEGTWDTSTAVQFEGVLRVDPYPRLVIEEQDGVYSSLLPVEIGKVGSQDRLASLAGQRIRLSGFLIQRHGSRVLELLPGSDAISSGDPPASAIPAPTEQDLGRHTLIGQIVDPKCYFGVMKPGDGKAHKVCATLCIAGGIPPMLVVRDTQGQTTGYLLVSSGNQPMPEAYRAFIADPVQVTGRVVRRGGALMLKADWETLVRME